MHWRRVCSTIGHDDQSLSHPSHMHARHSLTCVCGVRRTGVGVEQADESVFLEKILQVMSVSWQNWLVGWLAGLWVGRRQWVMQGRWCWLLTRVAFVARTCRGKDNVVPEACVAPAWMDEWMGVRA